ncbi:1-deoxy-D-xylulose-5-phosphate reductoisomerase [Planctomicrobium piriforme]|uniref:1-deoxy-D-xylulose 5-phosphate reductoisomerase n=1 Tax=Planctomicrobium piriforme TaxID=1576369 RepID=A0A1I3QTZ9_9PLAN|nr:1-deoxy-D-xylulose-5-phosphate reductoisomerase [Planctomicrobium piriforme]SFJ36979.1 1-deoxy-D-xylulose-5-phosphate reductoisomerase [Planctomicrobium piriforme]
MATDASKRIALLGATGSIGTSCQDVVRAQPGRMVFDTLTAHSRWRELAQACDEFRPRFAVLTGVRRQDVAANAFPSEVTVLYGDEAVAERAAADETDVVVSAIVGAAGLRGTWAAVEAGKTVALANKETMVVAGPLVTRLAARTGSKLIPVDSEHSAIFQALQCGHEREVARLILTASGGPFRTRPKEHLAQVTAADALDHPTWDMGPKITIDSATMMNKALEVIEARWLFGFPADQIEVVVHPQSIVHSMVEFVDGSVLAQLSPPDMRLPVQYALTWPERTAGVSPRLDLSQAFALSFEPPDLDRFPALNLGFEVARQGGTAGAVLNAANEVAVSRFLRGELSFLEIARLSRSILAAHDFEAEPTLDVVLRQDRWAREEAENWTSLMSHSQPCVSPIP